MHVASFSGSPPSNCGVVKVHISQGKEPVNEAIITTDSILQAIISLAVLKLKHCGTSLTVLQWFITSWTWLWALCLIMWTRIYNERIVCKRMHEKGCVCMAITVMITHGLSSRLTLHKTSPFQYHIKKNTWGSKTVKSRVHKLTCFFPMMRLYVHHNSTLIFYY